MVNLPAPCVVVLVGPGASGKSTWAAGQFAADVIVSSDRLRALVGSGEDDIEASTDAFVVLDEIVRRRINRRLTTVIDTLGLDADRRRAWRELARAAEMPCIAVAFDTTAAECRRRNRDRVKRIPTAALDAQLRSWPATRDALAGEGFDEVLRPQPVRTVAAPFTRSAEAARRQRDEPTGLRFALHIGKFEFDDARLRLAEIARGAESVGFDAIYVMDHFRQIPQLGRPWEDFLESYTTLAFLAAHTERVRIGTLVTGITYRNIAHLGKIVATLDVLSGGRAVCGLGLGWFEAEHRAYGWEFPPVRQRYELLEDALQVLPMLWGKGSPAFTGKATSVPETLCYPRPVQERIPIIVGGGGPRTLRLAAQYADMANVPGSQVATKAALLRKECATFGRDVALSQLSTILIGADDREVGDLVERLRPRRQDPARFAAAVNAGTVADHIGRFRELAEAGVSEVVVRLADLTDASALENMAPVIAAFR